MANLPAIEAGDSEWNIGLDALDLQLPPQQINVELKDGNYNVTKTDPHELQKKANKFREGYKNWRLKKPRGARGDVTDLKEQRPGAGEQESEEHGLQRARTMRVQGGEEDDKADEKKKEDERPHHIRHNKSSFFKPAAATDNKKPPPGMRRGKSFSVSITAADLGMEAEENWLKFFLNPYVNLLDAKKIQSQPLKTQNLEAIRRNFRSVRGRCPGYDRAPTNYRRICHVGVGGFHRSHQAVYTDELLELHKEHPDRPRWAICGIGLMPWDKKMYESLLAQDHMYTVLFRSQEGNDARVVGSIFDFVFAPDNYDRLFDTLFDKDTRIVSLTITEKGYCQRVDGNLDVDDANIKHDIEDLRHPRTALGMLVASLDQRRRAGRASFTVMSCDNQPDNGHQLEKLVLQMAEIAVGKDLREWIQHNTTFPNTMVDRITPATEDVHREILKQDFAVEDLWPVVAEHYGQWIVEDKFVDGRPDWEDAGVMFVPDVKPYEYMKLRLLNGCHSALSYVGFLSGFEYVDDAMNHTDIADFCQSFMDEVCLSVPSVPGVDLEGYKKNLISRFSNPYVKDRIERLMLDGSKKLPNTMRDAVIYLTDEGKKTTYLGVAVAAFTRYVSDVDAEGEELPEVLDPLAELLREPARFACNFHEVTPPPSQSNNGFARKLAALHEKNGYPNGGGSSPPSNQTYDPRGVVKIVFGEKLAENKIFIDSIERALSLICEKGMIFTLLHTY